MNGKFALLRPLLFALILLAPRIVAPAGAGEPAPPAAVAATPVDGLPADLFVPAAPEGAVSLDEARERAAAGETIVVRAQLGGLAEPFTPGLAMATLSDAGVMPCNAIEGHKCPTPWDMCCDATRRGRMATLQVNGPDGQPLPVGLEGKGGILPLSVLVVEAEVGPRPDPGVLILAAKRIFVEKPGMERPAK